MIYFEKYSFLQFYILRRYKSEYAKYKSQKKIFADLDQTNSLISDLIKAGFILEIQVAKQEGLEIIHESERRFILLEDKFARFQNENTTIDPQNPNELLTIDNICDLLKASRPTVYKLINENKLKSVEFLGRKRILYRDYIQFIKTLDR